MDRYFTEDEQARLLKHLKESACRDIYGRRDDAAIRALIHSGLRIGEFLQITVGQALEALRTDYLFVPREHRKGKKKDHQVFVTDALQQDLRDLLKVRHEQLPADCREDDALVISRLGSGITVRSFELRFKEHARAARLPADASPHWLRHTRAMNIMRRSTAKDPRGIAQRALGHASIRSTGIYTATPREEVEAALAEIDATKRRITPRQLRRAYEGRAAS